VLAATVIGLDPWAAVACVAVVMIGAALQGSIGIGLGLLAAPVLGLVDPDFVPAAISVSVVPLTVSMATRERGHIDSSGMGWAIAGRVPGVVVGAWMASAAGHRAIALVVGISVLFAVTASLRGTRFTPTTRNLFLAGGASGFTGTAAGVGGPPMALTYQHADPRVMRATLAAFFTVGAAMSITSLAISGVLGRRELQLSALLVPGVIAGVVLSRYTVAKLPADRVRPFVLGVCAASAIALLVDEVLGPTRDGGCPTHSAAHGLAPVADEAVDGGEA
jgi:uncharacterized membrane protein YfcA